MRQSVEQNLVLTEGEEGNQVGGGGSKPKNEGGNEAVASSLNQNAGSIITEPELINPVQNGNNISIKNPKPTKPVGNILLYEENEIKEIGNKADVPKPDKIPSKTTDQNKVYVDGGTTPNSDIIIKKPKPNYIIYGVIGIVGILVVYKLFFDGKSE